MRKDGNKLYRVSPHTLRHFFAWRYYEASGKDIVATKERLCHKKLNTTAVYVNALCSTQGRDKNIVDSIGI
jgi:site-specific recombinase XerC